MGAEVSTAEAADAHAHDDDHHHELPFWKKYIFSTDHKIIGYQYGITALIFLFIGFYLMMVMRWSIAHPDKELPGILAAFLNKRKPKVNELRKNRKINQGLMGRSRGLSWGQGLGLSWSRGCGLRKIGMGIGMVSGITRG